MMPRPAGLAGLLALGVAVGGCSSAGSAGPSASVPPSAVTTSASSDPADARTPLEKVLAGVPTEKSPIYRYSIKSSGDPGYGVIDPPDRIAEISKVQHFTNPSHTEITTTLLTRNKAWTKVTFKPAALASRATVPLKWMSLDPRKLKTRDGGPLVYDRGIDMAGLQDIFETVSDVRETSPDHFTGVTDLSVTADDEFLSAAQFKALGSKIDHVSFIAVLDSRGRLSTMTLRLPGAGKVKASTYVATFDEYGTVAAPKLPTAAGQTPAPAFVYDWYR